MTNNTKQQYPMNTLVKVIALVAFVLSGTFSTAVAQKTTPKPTEVEVRFKNNSFLFRKIVLVTYRPEDNGGNGTRGFVMPPFFSTTHKFSVGTKVYFANNRQVGVVMSGKKLEDKPFLTVKADDNGKSYKIFN
jgi:hypothetical protein